MAGPDPTELHAAAQQLRAIASGLDEPVAAVQRQYPHGSTWLGPAANHFYGDLNSAKGTLAGCASDLDSYAAALDRKANQIQQQQKNHKH